MKTKLQAFILFLTLFGVQTVLSQNGLIQLSGKLDDKSTGQPLIGAVVKIKDTDNSVTTDAEGKFTIKTANAFPIFILISFGEYENQEFKIENEKAQLNFQLEPKSILTNTVVVPIYPLF